MSNNNQETDVWDGLDEMSEEEALQHMKDAAKICDDEMEQD